jgi:DNA-binding transcriptional ArsR family regulator
MTVQNEQAVVIRDPRHFASVASARRMEIITSLGDLGPASIADLAERLGRSPHSLYYHMKLLEEAKVVHGVRKGKRKKEAIYELVARRILLGPDPKSEFSIQATERALDSILRLTSHEVSGALQSGAKRHGSRREVYGFRLKARMTTKSLCNLNRHIGEIEQILRNPGRRTNRGKLFALTVVLTPCRITK